MPILVCREGVSRTTGALLSLVLALVACGDGAVTSDPADASVDQTFGQITETIVEVVLDASGWATNRPKQRKIFAIGDRLWLFYSDGTNMKYVTSIDGENWSEPVVVRAARFGHRFGMWFDGTYLHYALNNAGLGEDVVYRRGRPDATGTILWDSNEHVVFDVPPDLTVLYPNVVVQASGEPWISFLHHKGGDHTPPEEGIVIRSTATDGSWETDPAFPVTLVAGSFTGPEPLGLSLANNTVVWLYNREGAGYFARSWRDGQWDDEEEITRAQNRWAFFAGLADGNDVHVTYGAGEIFHRIRRADGSWTPGEVVSTNASGHTGLTLNRTGHVVLTLFSGARFQIREWSSGTWSPPLTIAEHDSFVSKEKGWNFTVLFEANRLIQAATAFTTGSDDRADLRIVTIRQPNNDP